MRYWPLVMLGALPMSLHSQSLKPDEVAAIEKVCGRVTDSEYTRTGWWTYQVAPGGRPTKADVSLYRREQKKKCCAKQSPIAEIATESDGSFEFKGVAPGQYWMVVVVGKKKYKVALRLDPSSRNVEDCSDRIFKIKENELQISRVYRNY